MLLPATTGKSQVLVIVASTVALGDDVFNLKEFEQKSDPSDGSIRTAARLGFRRILVARHPLRVGGI